MSILKTVKDCRIELIKIFGNGISVKSYPTNKGTFQPHINYPLALGRLTDNQLSIIHQYGLDGSWRCTGRPTEYFHIYFKGKSEVKSNIEALTLMEALKPIASALVYTSK